MGRAMTHIDNAYYLPNVHINGTICRINLPPNTAFRGFGGPQGVATIENIIEEIASHLKRDALEIRMKNCYGVDDRNITPYGQVFKNNWLPRLFTETVERGEYQKRRNAVTEFNGHSKTHLRGLACTAVKFGISFNTKFLNQANALVNIYLDGSVQVSTGARIFGKLQRLIPIGRPYVNRIHRWSGRLAFLCTLLVAFHCIFLLGFQTVNARVLVHSAEAPYFRGDRPRPGWAPAGSRRNCAHRSSA